MNSINDQKIFRCKEHRKAFSQLEGVAFDIHRVGSFSAVPSCLILTCRLRC